MVYYLKINRKDSYVFPNLKRWIDIVLCDNSAIVYIICDHDDLTEMVKEKVDVDFNKVSFIKSEREDSDLKCIVEAIAVKNWQKAAYAHLTTFWHAIKNGYSEFWNIDADDTFLALSPQRSYEILAKAREYARDNNIKLFSLDMWFSRTRGHWSFGITYTDNTFNWMEQMLNNRNTGYMKQTGQPDNLDGYYTALKYEAGLPIESFYAENLHFIHYMDDMTRAAWGSGVFIWRNGFLLIPILKNFFENDYLGSIPIDNRVVKFDIGISTDESQKALFEIMREGDAYVINLKLSEQYKYVNEKKEVDYESEYSRVTTSVSYKIGRVITWIPRKIRKTIMA